eukprot:Em0013g811a
MRFLLSPFPPNITMKYDDPKVKFWRSLIISSCKQLKRLSFTEDQLVERFCWNTFRPRCLGPILDAMERQGDIQKQTNAIGADEGWVRWGVNILSKPVTWLWGSATTRTCVVEYVLQEAVKEVAEAIMAEHQRGVVYQNTDHVMLIAEYCQLCEKFVVPENTDVVARHMMKEGKIVQSTLQGGVQVIKFVPSGHGKVTEADLQIVHLKQAVLKMSAVVKNLCDEINRLRADALSKYRERDQSAGGILKRAKNKTAKLQKHELVLDNLTLSWREYKLQRLIKCEVKCPCCFMQSPIQPQQLKPAPPLVQTLLKDIMVKYERCKRNVKAGDFYECSTLPTKVEVKMVSRVLKRLASTSPEQILLCTGGNAAARKNDVMGPVQRWLYQGDYNISR